MNTNNFFSEFQEMDSIPNEYLTDTILRRAFPTARRIQVVECKKAENLINFSSEIIRLTVAFHEGDEVQNRNLILKIPPPPASVVHLLCIELEFYHKEKQILEVMIPLLNEIPIVSHRLPVHYLTIDEGTVVMEDLTFRGYKTEPESRFFDLEESGHIFKAMAEFHAATYKVHHENPHLLNDSAFGRTVAIDVRLDFMKTWNPVICELFKRKNATDMVPKYKAAVEFSEKTDADVYSMVTPDLFKFVTLNHGDLRKGNLMLKLNERGQIEDVKFIDFQTCWWSSPAYDFLFYLTFSVPIEVINEQFEDLVDDYWRHLNEALLRLECSFCYEKADFLKDIEKFHFMVLIWLSARCAFTCPLERQQVIAIYKRDDEETFRLCCQTLDDEGFTKSLWSWLQYCKKIKLFDTLRNEAENRND